MKKYLRKISAILVTVIMVLTMCLTAFAEGTEENPVVGRKPKEGDSTIATVSNVEPDVTVKAYKIVTADYTDDGFAGYLVVKAIEDAKLGISDIYHPAREQIQNISKAILAGTLKLEESKMLPTKESSTTYTADLTVGTWLVLVSGGTDKIYNPMLVSVYYKTDGSADNNEIDKDHALISAKNNWWLEPNNTYAKSEEQNIEKTIVNADAKTESGDAVSHGADMAVGDTVNYNIDSQFPSYSDAYKIKGVDVQIKDTLSKGLTLDSESIVVKVDGTQVGKNPEGTELTTYKITFNENESGFIINFASDFALANAGKKINVTYNAKINTKAGINFDPNTNKVELIYTNDPQNKDKHTTEEDTTYNYTFGIDAELFGKDTHEWNKETEEVFKTGESHIEKQDGKEVTTTRLSGAEFTLTRVNSLKEDENKKYPEYTGEGQKTWTASTNEYGKLSFTGLDAGYYLLTETKAPKPYTLEGKTHTVEISAVYNMDGTLKAYTIAIDGQKKSTYTATYENKTITNIAESSTNQSQEIKNTTIQELPSTGGIGTYFFTIVGVMIMAAVAGMFFVSRRKEHENQ